MVDNENGFLYHHTDKSFETLTCHPFQNICLSHTFPFIGTACVSWALCVAWEWTVPKKTVRPSKKPCVGSAETGRQTEHLSSSLRARINRRQRLSSSPATTTHLILWSRGSWALCKLGKIVGLSYLFTVAPGLLLHSAFSVCSERGLPSSCGGVDLLRLLLLQSTGARHAGFSRCSSQP